VSKVYLNAPLLHSTIVAWVIGINFICLSVGLAQSDLEVSGIFYNEKGQSYAIVNGSIHKVGSIINGAKIIEINKDFVRFENKAGLFDKRIVEKIKKQQQGEISRKNWLNDSVQSITKKVRDIFGVKQQDNKVSALPLIVVPKEQEEEAKKAEQERLVREEARRLNDVALKADYATKKEKNKILASQYRTKAERLCRNSPEMAKEFFLQAIECYKNVISYTVNIDEKLCTEGIIEEINKQIQGIENLRKK
jgi:hypothetical protein